MCISIVVQVMSNLRWTQLSPEKRLSYTLQYADKKLMIVKASAVKSRGDILTYRVEFLTQDLQSEVYNLGGGL